MWCQGAGGGKWTLFAFQEEAIATAAEKAMQDKVDLLIHARDGQIRARNAFGHGPRDTKG